MWKFEFLQNLIKILECSQKYIFACFLIKCDLSQQRRTKNTT